MSNLSVQAAAVIKRALEKRNGRDRDDLVAELDKRNIPAWYLPRGVRTLRDAYGAHFLICERGTNIYVLDPAQPEGMDYLLNRGQDELTRARHLQDGAVWLAKHYGDKGHVRKVRRAARNLVEELEDMLGVS